jgi:hypothetical protein
MISHRHRTVDRWGVVTGPVLRGYRVAMISATGAESWTSWVRANPGRLGRCSVLKQAASALRDGLELGAGTLVGAGCGRSDGEEDEEHDAGKKNTTERPIHGTPRSGGSRQDAPVSSAAMSRHVLGREQRTCGARSSENAAPRKRSRRSSVYHVAYT